MAIKSYKLVSRVRQIRPGYSALGLINKKKKKKKLIDIYFLLWEAKKTKKT